MNTSAGACEVISVSSASVTIPETVTKQHFESEMTTNSKTEGMMMTETLPENNANLKEGIILKMACEKANDKLNADSVDKVSQSHSATGQDSLRKVRKRNLELEKNLCKTAKVVEDTRPFDLAVSDMLHEGEQDRSLDVTEGENISSGLQNNPFGYIHSSFDSDIKASDGNNENYCHQTNTKICNVCTNLQTLQKHESCDINVDSSEECVLQRKVQTELEIAEIIEGISLLKLCSNLKKINQVNRNVCKKTECLSVFSLKTHCTANTGVVFSSMTKCRHKNPCFTRFCTNIETCIINKQGILSVDENNTGSSLFTSGPFASMSISDNEKNMDTSNIIYKKDGDSVQALDTAGTNDVMNKITEDKMSDTQTINNLVATNILYKINEENFNHLGDEGKYVDVKDPMYKSDEDNSMHVEGSTVKSFEARDINYKIDDMHVEHSVKDIDASGRMQKNYEEIMHVENTTEDAEASDLMSKSVEDDRMHVEGSVKDLEAHDLIYKNDENVMHVENAMKDTDASDLMSKSDEDDIMHVEGSVKDLEAHDLMYKNDVMHVETAMKNTGVSNMMYKSDEDDSMHIGGTEKDFEDHDMMYKNDDDIMHVENAMKDTDASDLMSKSDEDDIMHVGGTVKDLEINDLMYKNDVMHVENAMNDTDADDLMYKNDDVMHVENATKDTDAVDVLYKSDDDSMSVENTAKNMPKYELIHRSDDDNNNDVMHVESTVKDTDANNLMYESDEDDDGMSIVSSIKYMDTYDINNKGNENDLHDISSMKDKGVSEDIRKEGNGQIDINVDDLVSLVKDSVSIRDVISENTWRSFSIANKTNVNKRILDEMDVKDSLSDIHDLQDEMLSVMSTDKNEDDSSTCSMKDVMSEGSVVELTDIHSYRNVDVYSDNDTDTLRDESESDDELPDLEHDMLSVMSTEKSKDDSSTCSMKDVMSEGSVELTDIHSYRNVDVYSDSDSDTLRDESESDDDLPDLEHEMLSVMSTDKSRDDSSTCSMRDVMSEGSVVELTDIHSYRNVYVCSDNDTDTLRDESESDDGLTTNYEEFSDVTSLDDTITSDYIEEDVDDSTMSENYNENEEKEEEEEDDDDFESDSVSSYEIDNHITTRQKDAMSCCSVQDTSVDIMSMTSNDDDDDEDDDDDDEMSGLIMHWK